jgi:hypothetical protein
MRGKIAAAIAQAAEPEGLRVVKVPARGTSSFRSRRDGKVRHLTAPNGRHGHAWAQCTSRGHNADRNHLAAENVGRRALAPKAGRVRHKKTKKKHLAPRPKPARTRAKTGPTPKRPTTKTSSRARRRAGRTATPPPEIPPGHRQAEPEPQGPQPQVRTQVSYPAQRPLDGLPHAYRRRLKATPVLYR